MPNFKNRLAGDGRLKSSVPIIASGGNITGGLSGGGVTFSFPESCQLVRIVKRLTSSATFLIAINQTDVSESNWHEEMGPDDRFLTITSVDVSCLQIASDTSVTYAIAAG